MIGYDLYIQLLWIEYFVFVASYSRKREKETIVNWKLKDLEPGNILVIGFKVMKEVVNTLIA